MTRLLLTGAAGFIGHHFLEHLLVKTDWEIACLIRTGGAGSLRRLNEVLDGDNSLPAWDKRVVVRWHDLSSPINEQLEHDLGQFDYIVHMAALTHVDNSIKNAGPFVFSNLVGTYHMLEFARKQHRLIWFNQFSTDEVFGPAPLGRAFKEDDRYNATNPYAATKAGAEQLANAYANCYGIPILTTCTMNNFGERAGMEKFLPLLIQKVVLGEKVIIHADPTKTKSGTRFYIHARNTSAALFHLLTTLKGPLGRMATRFNVVGEREVANLDLAKLVAEELGLPLNYEMTDFHSSRPGHDLRYALDSTKLFSTGYRHPVTFDESLKKTIRWSILHPHWLNLTPDDVHKVVGKWRNPDANAS